METKIEWRLLLLHHCRSSTGPYHLSWTPLKSAVISLLLEQHGRSSLHAMGAYPWTTEHREGPPVWGTADFIATGDLYTEKV